eukprot:768245-Pleurochrysis_carterae.AAC.1
MVLMERTSFDAADERQNITLKRAGLAAYRDHLVILVRRDRLCCAVVVHVRRCRCVLAAPLRPLA